MGTRTEKKRAKKATKKAGEKKAGKRAQKAKPAKKAAVKKATADARVAKQKAFKKKAAKAPRRKPLALEVDPDVLEFIDAIERFKKSHARPFPSWSEILYVLRDLGYRKG